MKKPLVMLLSVALTFGMLTPFAQAASFKDVPTGYRFYNEISYLSDLKYISGFTDGTFGPEDKVTRAAAAAIIGRSLGLDGTKRVTTFKDVNVTNFASGYIDSAVKAGIILGFPDGTFRPEETVTRAQLAIFLSRGFKLQNRTAINFTDVSKNMKAYESIQKILAENITAGYPDNTFKPDLAVTRGQFAAFLARTLDDQFKPQKTHELNLRVVDYHNQFQSLENSIVSIFNEKGALVKEVKILKGTGYTSIEMPAGKYKLRVKAPGFEFYTFSEMDLNASTATTFIMYGEAKLQGTIKDKSGNPIAGANVQAKDRNGNIVWEAVTGSSGDYSFLLNEGTYSLNVEAEGYVESVKSEIVGQAYKDTEVNFILNAKEPAPEPPVEEEPTPEPPVEEEPMPEPPVEEEPPAEPYTLLELNKSYVSSDNEMTVTVQSIETIDKGDFFEYRITYEEANDTVDQVIDQGSFKIYYADGKSEPQYGFFNKLYPGEKASRSYVFKALKTQEPLLVEYGADLFFNQTPSEETLKWAINQKTNQ